MYTHQFVFEHYYSETFTLQLVCGKYCPASSWRSFASLNQGPWPLCEQRLGRRSICVSSHIFRKSLIYLYESWQNKIQHSENGEFLLNCYHRKSNLRYLTRWSNPAPYGSDVCGINKMALHELDKSFRNYVHCVLCVKSTTSNSERVNVESFPQACTAMSMSYVICIAC